MKYIVINDNQIEIEKKRIKNMYLRVLPPDGRIHISAPMRMSEAEIRRFIISKQDWIKVQKRKIEERDIQKELEYVTGDEINYLGKKYVLILQETESNSRMYIKDSNIILFIKKDSTKEQRKKVIDSWYRKILKLEIPELIYKWEQIIGVKSEALSIRDMKTRWGTCNVRTKKICLNLQLAKKPLECQEYVVVHELVHLLERSHNSVFKGYMDRFLPEWRRIKKELNGSK